jgi:hypothetical protein
MVMPSAREWRILGFARLHSVFSFLLGASVSLWKIFFLIFV